MDPRPVEVLHEGRWYPGWVRDQRREPDGRWRALVTFTVAPGESYYRWESEDVIRSRD